MQPWHPGRKMPKRVFSIQYSVFFAIVTLSMVIDCKQLFYIIYYIYNILSIQKVVTRAKKTEYWILNTFPCNRVLLCNMLIYMAKHSFLYRKTYRCATQNIELVFITNFQIVSLLKIAPYHMSKFGRYQIYSYLCTSNRRKCLRCLKAVFY